MFGKAVVDSEARGAASQLLSVEVAVDLGHEIFGVDADVSLVPLAGHSASSEIAWKCSSLIKFPSKTILQII